MMNSSQNNGHPTLVLDFKTMLLLRFLVDTFLFLLLRIFVRNYLLNVI